jgi:hypothetical protein
VKRDVLRPLRFYSEIVKGQETMLKASIDQRIPTLK